MNETVNINQKKLFIQLYDIFEKELVNIFEYIAPMKVNYNVFWNRVHELHLRVCTEIENIWKYLCKQIAMDKKDDFEKINTADSEYYLNYLDKYLSIKNKKIEFIWHLEIWEPIYKNPFWEKNWWTNYDLLKHNKTKWYSNCCLEDLIDSLWALYILLNYVIIWYNSCNDCKEKFYINPCKNFWINSLIFAPTCASTYLKIPIPLLWWIWRMIQWDKIITAKEFIDKLEDIQVPSNIKLKWKECLFYTSLYIREEQYWYEYIKTADDLKNLPKIQILQPTFAFVN